MLKQYVRCIRRTFSDRPLSLLQPSFNDDVVRSPLKFMVKHRRNLTPEEEAHLYKAKHAPVFMTESLLNSVINSMLKSDYVNSFDMTDTVESWMRILYLHMYPIHVKLSKLEEERMAHKISKKLLTYSLLDLKIRLRLNYMNPFLMRDLFKFMPQAGRGIMLTLEGGVSSFDGCELSDSIWSTILKQEKSDHTFQHIEIIQSWLLQTLEELNSYSNQEFVQLCMYDGGYTFPQLGQVAVKPDKLYTYVEFDEVGMPDEIAAKATKVTTHLKRL